MKAKFILASERYEGLFCSIRTNALNWLEYRLALKRNGVGQGKERSGSPSRTNEV